MTAWRPGCSLDALRRRAAVLADLRAFLSSRGVLEVETPLLGRHTVSDPCIDSVAAFPFGDDEPWYLQTSPEFAMKRLLAAHGEAIFQLGKVFRRAELGGRHNPEFTLLEWYRPGFDTAALIAEVADLVHTVLPRRPVRVDSYRALFGRELGVDPLRCGDGVLDGLAREVGGVAGLSRDEALDLLFSLRVERGLGRDCLQFVEHFPAARASLARTRIDPQGDLVADRFELFVDGLELANGYNELADATELRRRVTADNELREAGGRPRIQPDERLLSAMESGLPPCAGVALGVDRLLMAVFGATAIDQVMGFTAERA